MSEESGRRFQSSERSSINLTGQSVGIDATGNDSAVFGKRAWWLSYCRVNANDAIALEDALKWHARIVRELTRRIAVVSRCDLTKRAKTELVFELLHQRAQHSRKILNIDRALQREEDVDWRWW